MEGLAYGLTRIVVRARNSTKWQMARGDFDQV